MRMAFFGRRLLGPLWRSHALDRSFRYVTPLSSMPFVSRARLLVLSKSLTSIFSLPRMFFFYPLFFNVSPFVYDLLPKRLFVLSHIYLQILPILAIRPLL